MNNFLISVIVPCYNQAQFLCEALESVLEQTYTNWECIIVNDGSLDNTEEIAKEWILKDDRFRYLKLENGGLPNARNQGVALALGKFILPLDADDKLGNEYMRLGLEAFQKIPKLKVVYCKAEKFGIETGVLNLKPFSLENLARENMIFCSAIFKKDDFLKVGGYDVRMIYGLEDWELWIALLKSGGQVKRIEKVGFYYRIKKASMLKNLNKDKMKYSFEYLSVKHADFFVKYYGSFMSLGIYIEKIKLDHFNKLKSKKNVIDIFCKSFFGFTIFKKNK